MIGPMRRTLGLPLALALAAAAIGCESPKRFTTTTEVVQVEEFKDEKGQLEKLGLELVYADCPDARRILRADKAFAACAGRISPGDKLETELVSTWQSEKGSYRTEVVKLGKCALKQDPKEEANYEMVSSCTDVVTTGAVVGVRCDRTRSQQLVAKCPWLRRK